MSDASSSHDIDQLIDDLITREGGYSNHPADRGGPTR
jgi:lysozyme family protein